MTIFDAILVGFISAALGGVFAYLSWRAWTVLNGVIAAVNGLAKLAGQITGPITSIQQELAFMRALTGVATLPAKGFEPPPQAGGEAGTKEPPTPVQYPSALLDRFPVVQPPPPEPDADKEDTDLDLANQTEEELASSQILEEMRQRGLDVEDSDAVHPGVEANAE